MANRLFNQLIVILLFTNSAFSAAIHWTGLGASGVWEDPDNWDLHRVPEFDDRAFILGAYTVTYSSNITLRYLELDLDAQLTIAAGFTLTVTGSGNDGIYLDDNGENTTLIVKGTLIVYGNGQDGIDINDNTYVQVDASGSIFISDSASDGFELNGDLTNFGYISIANSAVIGLNAKGAIDRFVVNHGTIEISDSPVSLDGSNSYHFFNYGILKLYDASITLIDDGTNIDNYGIFQGDGIVENGNFNDLVFKPNSTLIPGTSVGKLTFEEKLDIKYSNIEIEINGADDYDQIEVGTQSVHTNGELDITGSYLFLSGDYVPQPGDEFMFFKVVPALPIVGHFVGLPEGSTLVFNGVNMTVSYTGGANGNAMTLAFEAPLPVELIEFNARPLANEVQLNWATASETNNDYFTIERSTDGRSFEAIATVYGMGTITEISKYYHTDKNPLNGLSYYRLKQTDFDGQFSYSDIKTVEFKNDETVKVYPTLVEDMVTLETNGSLSGEITVIVRDLSGKDCKSFEIAEKSEKIELPLNDLNPGSYFIVIYDGNGSHTQKIIKP